jgi:hypothetical protein
MLITLNLVLPDPVVVIKYFYYTLVYMSDKLYKTLKKLIGLDSTPNSTISSRKSSSRSNSTSSSRKSSSTNSTISSRKSSSRSNSTSSSRKSSSTKSSMYYTPEPSPTTQDLAKQFKNLPVEIRREIMCEVLSTENIVFIFDLFRNVNDIKRCPNFKHIRWSELSNIKSVNFMEAFEEYLTRKQIFFYRGNGDLSHKDWMRYLKIENRMLSKLIERRRN